MSREITVTLRDDLDGSLAAETFLFGFEGRWVEVELSEANAKKYRDMLAPLFEVGRPHDAGKRTVEVKPRRTAEAKAAQTDQNEAVREWARRNGYDIKPRGRVAAGVLEAFTKAHLPREPRTSAEERLEAAQLPKEPGRKSNGSPEFSSAT